MKRENSPVDKLQKFFSLNVCYKSHRYLVHRYYVYAYLCVCVFVSVKVCVKVKYTNMWEAITWYLTAVVMEKAAASKSHQLLKGNVVITTVLGVVNIRVSSSFGSSVFMGEESWVNESCWSGFFFCFCVAFLIKIYS